MRARFSSQIHCNWPNGRRKEMTRTRQIVAAVLFFHSCPNIFITELLEYTGWSSCNDSSRTRTLVFPTVIQHSESKQHFQHYISVIFNLWICSMWLLNNSITRDTRYITIWEGSILHLANRIGRFPLCEEHRCVTERRDLRFWLWQRLFFFFFYQLSFTWNC